MKIFRSNELNQNVSEQHSRLSDAFNRFLERYQEKPAAFSVGTKVFDILTFGMPSDDWSMLSFKGVPVRLNRRLPEHEIQPQHRS